MRVLVLLLLSLILATPAIAETSDPPVKANAPPGFQMSLVPDVALHDRTTFIKGFSLSLWGENPQAGFSLGFVNGTTGSSVGVLWGWVANYSNDYKGAQIGQFANIAMGTMTGLQWSVFNYAEMLKGLQWGVVNYAKAAESGIQIGFVNIIASNKRWFADFPEKLAPGFVFANWSF